MAAYNILKYFILSAFFLVICAGAPVSAEDAASSVVPQLEVQVETKTEDLSGFSWENTWATARQLVRSNQLEDAKHLYRKLFEEKPNIVEAKWEYCKILIILQNWKEAAQILDELLEYEPNNLEYLMAAGDSALRNQHFSKAVRYFGQVYESDPAGPRYDGAIQGMVEGFKGTGNERSAFLLLEQYYQQKGDSETLLFQLAESSKRLGIPEKERFYYGRLAEFFPDNPRYILEAAHAYDSPGYYSRAAVYWQKYLQLNPQYLPFQEKLAHYSLGIGDVDSALAHFIAIYRQDELDTDLALRIADLYATEKRQPDRALLYYEQYLNAFPNDRTIQQQVDRIRKDLALQYLPIVENDGELYLWEDLDLITQHKEHIFVLMVDFLEEQQKTEQAIRVLKILHENDRNNYDLLYRLAKAHHSIEEFQHAAPLINILHQNKYEDKGYLLIKADLELRQDQVIQAVDLFKTYLFFEPLNIVVLEEAVLVAGKAGLIEDVLHLWEQAPDKFKNSFHYLGLNLAFIKAFRANGLYTTTDGIYDALLPEVTGDREILAETYFHLADTLLQRGLLFEAEQVVRQVLVKNIQVDIALEKLIHISLLEGKISNAETWLALLAKRSGVDDIEELHTGYPENVFFRRLDILIEQKEYADALEWIAAHPSYRAVSESKTAFILQAELYRARILFYKEDFQQCAETLDRLEQKAYAKEEVYVLRRIIKEKTDIASNTAGPRNQAMSGPSFFSLINRAKLFYDYGYFEIALQNIEKAQQIVPESMVLQIRRVETLASLSLYDAALQAVKSIAGEFPDEEYFSKLSLQLEFKGGKFSEIVERVASQKYVEKEEVEPSPREGGDSMYFWKKLLFARALWAEGRREEAFKVYDSLLAVPVDSLFLEKMEVERINFNLPPLKKSFWNIVPFTKSEEYTSLQAVMEPQFVTRNIGQPVDDIAASLYGKYRWQELVKKELSARQAVEQRDYYRAEKEYLSLLEEEESSEALFDLAYIYNKLGLYGKAAEIYELMKERGPLYPGLDEYIEANVLKRQPRGAVSLYNFNRKGRDGYINLKKNTAEAEVWLMPSYDQEVRVSLSHNAYSSRDKSLKAESNTLLGTYSTYFENTVDLNISFGLDKPIGAGTSEVLYKFELIRRLTKSLDVYGRFEQDRVEDTLRSITDSIIYRDLEAGFKYDLFPRWLAGADYRYRMYSDNNEQNRYKLWTTYHLFGEVNQFKVTYSYENLFNDDENTGRDNNFRNDFPDDDRVYWSPEHYWSHLFTFHFTHFLDFDSRLEDPLSHLAFDYTFGYEDGNQPIHQIDANIFLEINKHFLLKGSFSNINGDDYQETQAAFSLMYRW